MENNSCRICLEENTNLLTPCKCKGTQKFICNQCYNKMINISDKCPTCMDIYSDGIVINLYPNYFKQYNLKLEFNNFKNFKNNSPEIKFIKKLFKNKIKNKNLDLIIFNVIQNLEINKINDYDKENLNENIKIFLYNLKSDDLKIRKTYPLITKIITDIVKEEINKVKYYNERKAIRKMEIENEIENKRKREIENERENEIIIIAFGLSIIFTCILYFGLLYF